MVNKDVVPISLASYKPICNSTNDPSCCLVDVRNGNQIPDMLVLNTYRNPPKCCPKDVLS